MDFFIIQVDDLDVVLTESRSAAVDCARRLAAGEASLEVRIREVGDEAFEAHRLFPVAEAATA